MEFHYGKGTSSNDSIGILGNIYAIRDDLSNLIDGNHQIASPTIEPCAFWETGKEIPIGFPRRHQMGFAIPPPTFTHDSDGYPFAITACGWFGAWAVIYGGNFLLKIIDRDKHPGDKVFEIGYHRGASVCGWPTS